MQSASWANAPMIETILTCFNPLQKRIAMHVKTGSMINKDKFIISILKLFHAKSEASDAKERKGAISLLEIFSSNQIF
jgi:hypothetical protein